MQISTDLVAGDVAVCEAALLAPDCLPGHHQPRPCQVESEASPGTASSGVAVPGRGQGDPLSPHLPAEGEVLPVQAKALHVQGNLVPQGEARPGGSLRDTAILLLLLLTETQAGK